MEHEEAGPAVDVLTNYSASFTLSDPNNCHNIPDIWQYFLYDLNAFKCQFYVDFRGFFFISSDCNLFCFNKIDNTLSLYICNSSVFAFTRCADMFSRYHNHLIKSDFRRKMCWPQEQVPLWVWRQPQWRWVHGGRSFSRTSSSLMRWHTSTVKESQRGWSMPKEQVIQLFYFSNSINAYVIWKIPCVLFIDSFYLFILYF